MKSAFLLLVLLFAASDASALTDYKCVNDCTAQGLQYGLCQSRCTTTNNQNGYNNQQQQNRVIQPKRTDYQCVSNCTQAGYMYNLCVDKCSY